MKRLFVVLALLVGLLPVEAEGPDEQYVAIYNVIQQADTLENSGQPTEALTKYVAAQSSLQRFQKTYPDWNPKVVAFRLNYLAGKIGGLSAKGPLRPGSPAVTPTKPAAAPTVAIPSAKPAPPSDWENQLNTLREQTRQLQADKVLLEAKLREALAAQPAAVDPRSLAEAEDKVKSLQKEKDLLKVTLAQEKARSALTSDPKALQQTQQALAEANRKLGEQTDKANLLATEKKALQTKLDNFSASDRKASAFEATKKALDEANAKLARQTELSTKLAHEKDALQARVKALSTDGEAGAALRAENQILKKQLADLRALAPALGKGEDPARKIAAFQAQLAALQSDKELLRLEKIALEGRIKQLSFPNATNAASSKTAEAVRIRQLERERDDLQKKLDAAIKQAYAANSKTADARVGELEMQLATLRSRLQVFEARPVPYTAEELALFKPPPAKLAAPDPKAGKKSVNELPAGSAKLVAEAQRYFSARQFDKAEEKYLQVLRQDQNNVYTLANLAAIELERGHLPEAEKHAKQALVSAPDDAYSLSILGYLKFRQEKYDEALDALSRAAQFNPESAEIQNFLGLTLSQKGMRGPAETALRKAIQLEPAYGSAHNNLAVIYLTQQPAWVELARWHYQKALAAGHPRNLDLEKMLDAKKTAEIAH